MGRCLLVLLPVLVVCVPTDIVLQTAAKGAAAEEQSAERRVRSLQHQTWKETQKFAKQERVLQTQIDGLQLRAPKQTGAASPGCDYENAVHKATQAFVTQSGEIHRRFPECHAGGWSRGTMLEAGRILKRLVRVPAPGAHRSVVEHQPAARNQKTDGILAELKGMAGVFCSSDSVFCDMIQNLEHLRTTNARGFAVILSETTAHYCSEKEQNSVVQPPPTSLRVISDLIKQTCPVNDWRTVTPTPDPRLNMSQSVRKILENNTTQSTLFMLQLDACVGHKTIACESQRNASAALSTLMDRVQSFETKLKQVHSLIRASKNSNNSQTAEQEANSAKQHAQETASQAATAVKSVDKAMQGSPELEHVRSWKALGKALHGVAAKAAQQVHAAKSSCDQAKLKPGSSPHSTQAAKNASKQEPQVSPQKSAKPKPVDTTARAEAHKKITKEEERHLKRVERQAKKQAEQYEADAKAAAKVETATKQEAIASASRPFDEPDKTTTTVGVQSPPMSLFCELSKALWPMYKTAHSSGVYAQYTKYLSKLRAQYCSGSRRQNECKLLKTLTHTVPDGKQVKLDPATVGPRRCQALKKLARETGTHSEIDLGESFGSPVRLFKTSTQDEVGEISAPEPTSSPTALATVAQTPKGKVKGSCREFDKLQRELIKNHRQATEAATQVLIRKTSLEFGNAGTLLKDMLVDQCQDRRLSVFCQMLHGLDDVLSKEVRSCNPAAPHKFKQLLATITPHYCGESQGEVLGESSEDQEKLHQELVSSLCQPGHSLQCQLVKQLQSTFQRAQSSLPGDQFAEFERSVSKLVPSCCFGKKKDLSTCSGLQSMWQSSLLSLVDQHKVPRATVDDRKRSQCDALRRLGNAKPTDVTKPAGLSKQFVEAFNQRYQHTLLQLRKHSLNPAPHQKDVQSAAASVGEAMDMWEKQHQKPRTTQKNLVETGRQSSLLANMAQLLQASDPPAPVQV